LVREEYKAGRSQLGYNNSQIKLSSSKSTGSCPKQEKVSSKGNNRGNEKGGGSSKRKKRAFVLLEGGLTNQNALKGINVEAHERKKKNLKTAAKGSLGGEIRERGKKGRRRNLIGQRKKRTWPI